MIPNGARKAAIRSRVLVRVRAANRLRAHLKRAIERDYLGSVLDAAKSLEIPQPTLWRVLNGKRDVILIEAKTERRLRRLLRELDEDAWESLFRSPQEQAALRAYVECMEAEVKGYMTAYGLANSDWPGLVLSRAGHERLELFRQQLLRQRHHPQRVHLAMWRVRAPFILGDFAGGLEPSRQALNEGGLELKVIELGIRREEILLRRAAKL